MPIRRPAVRLRGLRPRAQELRALPACLLLSVALIAEANAQALRPGLHMRAGAPVERLLVSAVEHASVLSGGQFPAEAIDTIRVTRSGVLDLEQLHAALDGKPPALVSAAILIATARMLALSLHEPSLGDLP